MLRLSRQIQYIPVYLLYTVLIILTARFPFFWDTIQLGSKHASFFYDSGFSTIILPNEIDSGHIPSLGIYIAVLWKIFGRSLLVSHLAMLPFIAGIIWQSQLLVNRLFSEEWRVYALLIILADATLLAQCTLVSPDVLLIFFFLLAINSLLRKKKTLYMLSLAGLTLTSMRGMMCVAGLYCAELTIYVWSSREEYGKGWWRKAAIKAPEILISYLPAIVIAGAFFLWHYYQTGWIGYHRDMPWYQFFEPVGAGGALRNVLILGWRLIDFGRIFIWAAGAFCMWHYYRNRPSVPADLKYLIVILIFVCIGLFQAVILHKNLSGHRYLMPVYILFSILVTGYLFSIVSSPKVKKVLFYVMIAGLLTGNLWIYPDTISKGWDSSLAYLPYFPLREKMMGYMEDNNISLSETGTLFPNEGSIDYIDLSGRDDSFSELDLSTNKYVFYSNVFNGFTDDELYELRNKWSIIRSLKFMGVKIILYGSPHL